MYFNLFLNFTKKGIPLKAKYFGYKDEVIEKFTRQADVDAVISNCKNGSYTIEDCKKVKHQESPKLPFCTATFQQEAANRLGLKVKDAMSCAQKLFEGININGEHVGLITYLRTDSTELAPEFVPVLKDFLENTYGADKYIGVRKAKKNSIDRTISRLEKKTDKAVSKGKDKSNAYKKEFDSIKEAFRVYENARFYPDLIKYGFKGADKFYKKENDPSYKKFMSKRTTELYNTTTYNKGKIKVDYYMDKYKDIKIGESIKINGQDASILDVLSITYNGGIRDE
jgi:hypothetical protein